MSILSDILSGLGKQSYESRIEARIYNVVLNSLIYCRHSGMDEYLTAREHPRLPLQATELQRCEPHLSPAVSGLPSSVTVRRSTAQCHLPQKEG